jgi:hypothetical protein
MRDYERGSGVCEVLLARVLRSHDVRIASSLRRRHTHDTPIETMCLSGHLYSQRPRRVIGYYWTPAIECKIYLHPG